MGAKARDDGKGRKIGVGRLADCSNSRNSPETSVDDHHLAVEVGEGAEAKIAMALQLADGDDTLRDALDQRARGGHLEKGGMRNLQMVGERAHDDVIDGLAGRPRPLLESVHQRLRNFTTQVRHDLSLRQFRRFA